MVSTWPRTCTVALGGRSCCGVVQHLLDAGGDAAQIAILGRGIDIESRLDGIMRHHRIAVFAVNVAEPAQQLEVARLACR